MADEEKHNHVHFLHVVCHNVKEAHIVDRQHMLLLADGL